ncbi:formate dehydrogenase subunit gamma [Profundibacter amoris]|uniref:Formate dehydrogenase subunit gamma n=1 Tax=Profundibacter amoris TaxID=2171755 RepID=A0A347UK40_9RHOB|nr:formate dehydrogenase subunit gamma [Profundibacter amoris]AXX99218.1 formate dehydrogenase subunit gamma [Profundibacter amoris]
MQDTLFKPARISVGKLVAGFALLLVILMLFGVSQTYAQSVRAPGNAVNLDDGIEEGPSNALGEDSQSDFWRNFRGGDPNDIKQMISALPEGAVMTTTGEHWRLIRENYIRKYAGWFPLGVIGILLLYHLIKGKMRIPGGYSDNTLTRFNINQRVAHWFMAGVFIILGITGLIILLGRPLIAPYLGKEVNSILTSASMQGHNLFGPLFILALLWMFFKFVRGNFFQIVDLKWIFKMGGFFGGHVSSSQFNFGEKTWFWIVILVGIVMSVTGILLLFPWLVDDLRWLQLSTILHAGGAILLISVLFGHIYVGTVGMEGSLDSMLKGQVDENWAKAHHDLWYEEVTGKSATESTDKEGTS